MLCYVMLFRMNSEAYVVHHQIFSHESEVRYHHTLSSNATVVPVDESSTKIISPLKRQCKQDERRRSLTQHNMTDYRMTLQG